MTVVVVTFLASLGIFVLLGAAAIRQAKPTRGDYLVASRSVPGWLVALSAVATNNSGYMFVGLIGFTYAAGFQAAWLQSGWIVGDVFLWLWFHRRLREKSGELDATSIPTVLASGPKGLQRRVVVGAALFSLPLLAAYAAAQLNAGSKALHVLFGWEPYMGALIGAVIVLLYSVAGGIRASIWTDAAQSFVMIGSMFALVVAALTELGGVGGLLARLEAIDPTLVEVWPADLRVPFALWYLGWVLGGLGVAGQPHIVIRTMAMRDPSEVRQGAFTYFAWYVPFSALAILAGLSARVLLPEAASFDAELALPRLALELLPGVFVGLMLAGLFAATMSTADSLILSCSAAISQDLLRGEDASSRHAKWATAGATVVALGLALAGPQSVFVLVLIAWSALGATFGPLLALRLADRPVGANLALAIMAAGLLTSLAWRFGLGWHGDVYELLPGALAGFAVAAAGGAFGSRSTPG